MRQLWVQLSLAFSALVLISATLLLILLVSYPEFQQETRESESNLPRLGDWIFSEQGIATQLQTHFDNDGTVEGAIALVARFESTYTLPRNAELRLRNANGEIVHGRLIDDVEYEVLDFDGISVEYHAGRPSRSDGLPPGVLPPISLFTFLGVVGIVIGILFGIIVSRWLVAPLSRLAAMVRQAGSRNFKLRITPEGSEEIQDVARAFNEMATQLETSEKLRNNLIADVAHELRTPLTVMQSNLRALLDDIYPLSKAEILTLYDQTRHLTQLVNDLHELSLADAHELPISQQNINLNHFLKTIADIFKPIAEAENIEFVMEITQTPLRVSGDEVRLKQVIQNMLVNAHRHTPSGGKITLQLYAKENQAAIRVIDTGEGISEEHIEHIFERFYRADLSRQRANGGTGLGLAIGKAIIEAHGGEISVTSRVNSSSGTCFEILLPVRI